MENVVNLTAVFNDTFLALNYNKRYINKWDSILKGQMYTVIPVVKGIYVVYSFKEHTCLHKGSHVKTRNHKYFFIYHADQGSAIVLRALCTVSVVDA